MFIVPTFQNRSSKYIMESELNLTIFRLRFQWNTRESAWYMDILDQNDIPILNNVKLVINYLLLLQYKAYSNLPNGDFMIIDLNNNSSTGGITYANFGVRYQLVFLSSEEIEERRGNLNGV